MRNRQPSRRDFIHRIALPVIALFCGFLAVAGAGRSQAQILVQPAPTYPAAGYFEGRVTGASSLNLRTGPHISYTAVAFLMEGEQVRLIGRNRAATWYQIQLYNGYQGWVNARYIRPNVNIAALPVADVPLLGITAFVTNDPIMVYAGPGRLHIPVAIAQPGKVLILNARNDNASWLFAYLPDGSAGWIPADSSFLPSSTINNLPIITPFSDTTTYPTAYYLVYSGPGFLFEPFYRVDLGQTMTIRGRTADARWVLVQVADGREGWLTADIVQVAVPLERLPVIPGIAPPQGVSWQPTSTPHQAGSGPGTLPAPATPTETPTTIATATATATATIEPTATSAPVTATAAGPTATQPPGTPAPTATATATRPAPLPTATATQVPGVPVYRTPNAATTPFATLAPGESVEILGRTADAQWIKISLPDDREGWVRAVDVQLDLDLDTLPIVTP